MNLRISLVLSSLILAACGAPGANVVKTYELAKPVGAPYSRVLVVGAHPDRAVRRHLEESMVNALRVAQIDAISSISLMDPELELSRETVGATAESTRVDAVLVSRPQDVRWSVREAEPRSTTEALRREANDLFDFFRYDYVEYQDPMTLTAVREVMVSSDLYRVSDRTLVWSVESKGIEKDSAMDAIQGIASSTSRQLVNDGLVR